MNKDLIDALETHAEFHVGNEHYDKSFEEQQRIFVEFFARLIVQECLFKIEVWEQDSRNHVSYLLKQHFGIEPRK